MLAKPAPLKCCSILAHATAHSASCSEVNATQGDALSAHQGAAARVRGHVQVSLPDGADRSLARVRVGAGYVRGEAASLSLTFSPP
jgi:hypothetical protein